jgi:hypothetical protein
LPPGDTLSVIFARPLPPVLSAAVTVTPTLAPLTVAPLAGDVIVTVGGVVSVQALVEALRLACPEVLAAASKALTAKA